ncbi:glutamate 5-kinase [Portibacter marinus]|uniref:glutamate 5-kinase n=1 Tax=Portibacter marinus TaxID=2898660 RepID=UPI001F263538|nr:glutamate 5-kinase [Portibacter marinus]
MDRKKVILKLGTSTLTKNTEFISRGKIEEIARQIRLLKDEYSFIIVSSGAIAVAKQFVQLAGKQSIEVKQALASIGQPHLMRIFMEVFSDIGLHCSQCLISYQDFEHTDARINIKRTVDVLLANDYIPIINENDTVATDEIKFGDNDMLAGKTAALLGVDLLIIATNTDGVYKDFKDNHGTTIEVIEDLDEITLFISKDKSAQGSGGMASKIEAAKIAQKAGVETWLVNGHLEGFIDKAFNNESKISKIKVLS